MQIGSAFWLRTPVGKMHTDRYIPLHPSLKQMLDRWLAASARLAVQRPTVHRPRPSNLAPRVDKAVQKAATAQISATSIPINSDTSGHPGDQPRHEPRGDAALLGHRSLSMTMVYARIADRTVADEYFKVSEKVEALYDTHQPAQLPADEEGRQMRKFRSEMH